MFSHVGYNLAKNESLTPVETSSDVNLNEVKINKNTYGKFKL